ATKPTGIQEILLVSKQTDLVSIKSG
ncbi:hypothetical protein N499_0399B, partial [Wolbachia pipientis wVitA]